jgi:LemA protein
MGGWLGFTILIVVAFLGIGIYNSLVTLRQRTRQAFADIDVQLKQRHDLIPNLVEIVKGYAAHERETLDAVVKARNAAIGAGSMAEQAGAENILTSALNRLLALAEAYPDLKANQNFLELQRQLDDIENKLAAARRFFNSAVAEYNTGREQFPAVLVAGAFGFQPRDMFDLGEQGRATMSEAPKVSFN